MVISLTRYLAEAAQRDQTLELLEKCDGSGVPLVWCPIGSSGDKLVRVLGGLMLAELATQVSVVELVYDKSSRTIQARTHQAD